MIENFSQRLAVWQEQYGRHGLPWQRQGGYATWVSEIMLQQTQVQVVVPYFQKFIEEFPTISDLASAPLDSVLAHWAGLGYYSRARNLHKAAKIIVSDHHREIPKDLDLLIQLPGIGRSTAGAILSLGFGLRGVIQDGNVRRVLSRLFCIHGDLSKATAQKTLWELADQLTPKSGFDACIHTQAMMDLGSIVCRRSKPTCTFCPIADDCQANQRGEVSLFPEPKRVKQRPDETWVVLQLENERDETLFLRRPLEGIWGGLYTPPINSSLSKIGELLSTVDVLEAEYQDELTHAFSHFRVHLKHYRLKVHSQDIAEIGMWFPIDSFQKGVPAPINKLLNG
ncbi:MAG: A/G-specific adenine glycosylase [Pseudomonadota bacterium]|nr:A/G-specific adenine glycosylase [Pseudomonadota bacterium]